MLKIIFTYLMFAGYITPMDECNDGREMYVLILSDGGIIEHVYEEEVYRYIKEGEFEYDETYMYDAEKSLNCLCEED
jgi:hypothetical protein